MASKTMFAGVMSAMLVLSALPAAAQGLNLNPLGLDLDPFHIITPAAPPAAAAPAVRAHHRGHHHYLKRHHPKH